MFDIAYIGHYTHDTVILPDSTVTQKGGAFYYGCHVATAMGLKVAVITRLARQHLDAMTDLEKLGVTVFAKTTRRSTCLRLVYPTANLDQRVIYADSTAGPFTPAEVANIQARTFHIGASIRGEVPLKVVQALAAKGARLSLDVQGFIRVNQGGRLVFDHWPEAAAFLRPVNVLKTDAVEAEAMTGHADLRRAAADLAALGPQEVLITHNGGVLVYADGQYHEATFRAKSLAGRTGRGDTCISAYLGKRLTAGPAEATRWAAALTSLKLETPGPFRRSVDEVEDRD